MKIGTVDGKVDGIWQVAYDSGELAGTATNINITGITADTNMVYKLLTRGKNAINGTGYTVLRFNNDSGNNYSYIYLNCVNTTVSAGSATSNSYGDMPSYGGALNDLSWSVIDIFAKSGNKRASVNNVTFSIGSVVGGAQIRANAWANTANEITSIDIIGSAANCLAAGTRVILLQLQNCAGMDAGNLEVQGDVEDALQLVYESALDTPVSSLTISDLDGDNDQIYYFEAICQDNDTVGSWLMLLNNDATAANYLYQYQYYYTSIGANRSTNAGIIFNYTNTDNNLGFTNGWIYAKSGQKRTAMFLESRHASATALYDMVNWHWAYTDTSTNITSIVLSCAADTMGAMSYFKLYRINL